MRTIDARGEPLFVYVVRFSRSHKISRNGVIVSVLWSAESVLLVSSVISVTFANPDRMLPSLSLQVAVGAIAGIFSGASGGVALPATVSWILAALVFLTGYELASSLIRPNLRRVALTGSVFLLAVGYASTLCNRVADFGTVLPLTAAAALAFALALFSLVRTRRIETAQFRILGWIGFAVAIWLVVVLHAISRTAASESALVMRPTISIVSQMFASSLLGVVFAQAVRFCTMLRPQGEGSAESAFAAALTAMVISYLVGQGLFSLGVLASAFSGVALGYHRPTLRNVAVHAHLKNKVPAICRVLTGFPVVLLARETAVRGCGDRCCVVWGVIGVIIPLVAFVFYTAVTRFNRSQATGRRHEFAVEQRGISWVLSGTPTGLASCALLIALTATASGTEEATRAFWGVAGTLAASTVIAMRVAVAKSRSSGRSPGATATEASAKSIVASAAIRAVERRRDELAEERPTSNEEVETAAARLIRIYRSRLSAAVSPEVAATAKSNGEIKNNLECAAVSAQRDVISHLLAAGTLDDEIAAKLIAGIANDNLEDF